MTGFELHDVVALLSSSERARWTVSKAVKAALNRIGDPPRRSRSPVYLRPLWLVGAGSRAG